MRFFQPIQSLAYIEFGVWVPSKDQWEFDKSDGVRDKRTRGTGRRAMCLRRDSAREKVKVLMRIRHW